MYGSLCTDNLHKIVTFSPPSVIRQLLFQAKIGFQNMGDSGMVDQCDVYLARVDLLRVMVGANFQDLPTIRELTKMDSVR